MAEPADRGRLEIRRRVFSRIACAEALEVDGVIDSSQATSVRTRGKPLPRATVIVDRDASRVIVSLHIATSWPVPLDRIARTVQDRVAERITRYTGFAARRVDVAIDLIAPPPVAPDAALRKARVS